MNGGNRTLPCLLRPQSVSSFLAPVLKLASSCIAFPCLYSMRNYLSYVMYISQTISAYFRKSDSSRISNIKFLKGKYQRL